MYAKRVSGLDSIIYRLAGTCFFYSASTPPVCFYRSWQWLFFFFLRVRVIAFPKEAASSFFCESGRKCGKRLLRFFSPSPLGGEIDRPQLGNVLGIDKNVSSQNVAQLGELIADELIETVLRR